MTHLEGAVADLYAELRVARLLRRLQAHTRHLLDAVAGSISVVDVQLGRYIKIAESGVPCRLGLRFSLSEGATGQAFSQRRPVVIDDYGELPVGHLPTEHPAAHGTAVGVPMWWRGEVVGVNVAFAGRRRRFSPAELDDVDVLSQSATPALVRASGNDPLLARLLGAHQDTARGTDRTGAEWPGKPAHDPEIGTVTDACPLTNREKQVLGLLAGGLSDRELAARLVISPKTVHKHVGAVLRKSDTPSRTAAVVRALERGWLTPDDLMEMGNLSHTEPALTAFH